FADGVLEAPEARIEFTFEIYLHVYVIVERLEQITRCGFDRVPLFFSKVDAEEPVRRDEVDEHNQRHSVGQLQQVPYFPVPPVYHDRALNTTLVVASMRKATLRK